MAGNGTLRIIGWLTLMVILLGIVIGVFATLQTTNRSDIKMINECATDNEGDIKVLKAEDVRFKEDILYIKTGLRTLLERLP